MLHKSFAFPISSFPLRLNPVPPQSRSLQCYSVATHSSSPFETFPPPLLSKFFRNVSFRLYVLPTQFIISPNYSISSQLYAVPMLFTAFRIVTSPAHYCSMHLHSITYHFIAAPFHYLTSLGYSLPTHVYPLISFA